MEVILAKKSLFLLIILMLHSLFVSAMATSHVSVEKHSQFEVPHIHVGGELTDDEHFHDLPWHDVYAESQDNSTEADHDHEGVAHIHLSGDHSSLPFDIDAFNFVERSDLSCFYQLFYVGLHYKPAVPPPNT